MNHKQNPGRPSRNMHDDHGGRGFRDHPRDRDPNAGYGAREDFEAARRGYDPRFDTHAGSREHPRSLGGNSPGNSFRGMGDRWAGGGYGGSMGSGYNGSGFGFGGAVGDARDRWEADERDHNDQPAHERSDRYDHERFRLYGHGPGPSSYMPGMRSPGVDEGNGQRGAFGTDGDYAQRERLGQTHRGKGPKGYTRSDDRVKEIVSEHLMDHHDIDPSEISVEVKDGEVTLTGTVHDRTTKRLVEAEIEGIAAVKDVINLLRVRARGTEDSERDAASVIAAPSRQTGRDFSRS